jgi:hypothetical protein
VTSSPHSPKGYVSLPIPHSEVANISRTSFEEFSKRAFFPEEYSRIGIGPANLTLGGEFRVECKGFTWSRQTSWEEGARRTSTKKIFLWGRVNHEQFRVKRERTELV